MRLLCLLLCITNATCFYIDTNSSRKEKIVGGDLADIKEEYYFAALYYFKELICGSAIITKDWLLSAEKCFIYVVEITVNLKAVTGTMFDNGTSSLFIDVEGVKKYSNDFPDTDVYTNPALVLLAESIKTGDLQNPIPLSNSDQDPPPRTLLKIVGFGKTSLFNKHTSSRLRKATLTIIDPKECNIAASHLVCAKVHRKDACFGDEGGPAVINNNVLFAIITGTPNCEYGSLPSIHTKVGPFYTWIINATQKFQRKIT